ncbi:flavodoxin family protein [Telmatobacter bradus]|uniref:flavodoxin family protein n=1 Tax=Telmatobacter bradus TaxID=474953 RepID=UPI003B4282A4
MLVSIVYDSHYGHTAKQANAVAKGVRRVPGVECKLFAVADGPISWEEFEQSDAIIFGSPTYNGNLTARLKQFFEDSTQPVWRGMKWRNKIAAGFTYSGALNGDKMGTLISMALFAAQNGMIWVGLDLFPGNSAKVGVANELNRLGSWLGAMGQSNSSEGENPADVESDMNTAAYLGERVAKLAKQFQAGLQI